MVCIYEDEGYADLYPLVDLRPVFGLRCGWLTLFEKFRKLYPREVFHLWVRDELAEVTTETYPGCRVNRPLKKGRLFFSARFIPHERVPAKGRESVLMCGDEVAGFRVCADCAVRMSSLKGLVADLAVEQVKGEVVKRPWDLVELTPAELERELGRSRKPSAGLSRGVTVVGPKAKLSVARGARLWPGAVVSTGTGPVMLDRKAEVRPGSFVEGPCYVGPGTVIDGAKVRPKCSFGPECRVGGEVEATVFQGHANKHHDGFIGHGFIGEWANLGAGTTNSDLKNAYQPVTVQARGKTVDTGLLKVGCFIGDHAKTAIGTLLNTGTVVGPGANWFEPGLSPREIPAFAWGARKRWKQGELVETARAAMARRGVEMAPAYEKLLGRAFRLRRRD